MTSAAPMNVDDAVRAHDAAAVATVRRRAPPKKISDLDKALPFLAAGEWAKVDPAFLEDTAVINRAAQMDDGYRMMLKPCRATKTGGARLINDDSVAHMICSAPISELRAIRIAYTKIRASDAFSVIVSRREVLDVCANEPMRLTQLFERVGLRGRNDKIQKGVHSLFDYNGSVAFLSKTDAIVPMVGVMASPLDANTVFYWARTMQRMSRSDPPHPLLNQMTDFDWISSMIGIAASLPLPLEAVLRLVACAPWLHYHTSLMRRDDKHDTDEIRVAINDLRVCDIQLEIEEKTKNRVSVRDEAIAFAGIVRRFVTALFFGVCGGDLTHNDCGMLRDASGTMLRPHAAVHNEILEGGHFLCHSLLRVDRRLTGVFAVKKRTDRMFDGGAFEVVPDNDGVFVSRMKSMLFDLTRNLVKWCLEMRTAFSQRIPELNRRERFFIDFATDEQMAELRRQYCEIDRLNMTGHEGRPVLQVCNNMATRMITVRNIYLEIDQRVARIIAEVQMRREQEERREQEARRAQAAARPPQQYTNTSEDAVIEERRKAEGAVQAAAIIAEKFRRATENTSVAAGAEIVEGGRVGVSQSGAGGAASGAIVKACYVCMCEIENGEKMFECPCEAPHPYCADCFNHTVLLQSDETLVDTFDAAGWLRAAGRIRCGGALSGVRVFSDAVVANASPAIVALYMQSRLKAQMEAAKGGIESRIASAAAKAAEEVAAAAANPNLAGVKTALSLVDKAKRFIQDRILTNRCPGCQAPFSDFVACASVKCGCGTYFCGLCLEYQNPDSHTTHMHVKDHCGYNPNPGQSYAFAEAEATQQAIIKARADRVLRFIKSLKTSSENMISIVSEIARDMIDTNTPMTEIEIYVADISAM
jgi:hypothetical protein